MASLGFFYMSLLMLLQRKIDGLKLGQVIAKDLVDMYSLSPGMYID